MRIDPVNYFSQVQSVVPAKVNPVQSTTNASQSGIRPEDVNKFMSMSIYDKNGKTHQTNIVRNFSDLFSGGRIDVRA